MGTKAGSRPCRAGATQLSPPIGLRMPQPVQGWEPAATRERSAASAVAGQVTCWCKSAYLRGRFVLCCFTQNAVSCWVLLQELINSDQHRCRMASACFSPLDKISSLSGHKCVWISICNKWIRRFSIMPGKMEAYREQGMTCPLLKAALLRGGPARLRVALPVLPAGWMSARSSRKATLPCLHEAALWLRYAVFQYYKHHGNTAPLPSPNYRQTRRRSDCTCSGRLPLSGFSSSEGTHCNNVRPMFILQPET